MPSSVSVGKGEGQDTLDEIPLTFAVPQSAS